MKLSTLGIVSLCVFVGGTIGCGKKEEPSPPPAPAAVPAQPEAPKMAAPTPAPAPAAPSSVTESATKVAGLISKARTLIDQKDYAGALNVLKELSAQKLTPDQQKTVDELQATAQKQAANAAVNKAGAEAGKAIGGLLGK